MSKVQTIQLTGKRLKFHMMVSYFLIILGLFTIMLNSGPKHDDVNLAWGCISALLGFIWLGVTRVRIWWNHK